MTATVRSGVTSSALVPWAPGRCRAGVVEKMLLNGGQFSGTRLLAPSSVAQMVSDTLPRELRIIASPFTARDAGRKNGWSFGFSVALHAAEGRALRAECT